MKKVYRIFLGILILLGLVIAVKKYTDRGVVKNKRHKSISGITNNVKEQKGNTLLNKFGDSGYNIVNTGDKTQLSSIGIRDKKDMKDEIPSVEGAIEPTIKYAMFMVSDDISSDYEVSDVVKTSSVISDVSFSESGGNTIKPGLLTAGEVNDFSKWKLWKDISENQLNQYRDIWKIKPTELYSVQLRTKDGFPVINARVELINNKGEISWSALTDNTGKAELWNRVFASDSLNEAVSATIKYNGKSYKIEKIKEFHKGMNVLKLPEEYTIPDIVDIAFVVDATGSMADEINYLKAELKDVMLRAKDTMPGVTLRLGSVFYRDFGDNYVTTFNELSENIEQTVGFVQSNSAGGGGDTPEAVDIALQSTLQNLNWSKEARTRLVFLVLDAPPHTQDSILQNMGKMIKEAAQQGVRIVPVACSGIDKSTEYLMRSIALLTNGTYTFLTDDSGFGGSHLKPTTDKYDVELFNNLLLRLIYQYTYVPELIQEKIKSETLVVYKTDIAKEDSSGNNNFKNSFFKKWNNSESIGWKYYPNPTDGPLTIKTQITMGEIYINDLSGKILERHIIDGQDNFTLDLSAYPNGTYFISYEYEPDKWLSGKVIIIH